MKYTEFCSRWANFFLFGKLTFWFQLVFLGYYSCQVFIKYIGEFGLKGMGQAVRSFVILYIVLELSMFCTRYFFSRTCPNAAAVLKNIPYKIGLLITYIGYLMYPVYFINSNFVVYLTPMLCTFLLLVFKRLAIKVRP